MIINPYSFVTGNNCVAVQNTDTIYGTGTLSQFEVPFYGLYNYGESANIMLQSSIGASKNIWRVAYYFTGWTIPYTFSSTEIWMAHVVQSEFPASVSVGYSTLTLSNLTKVWSGSWTISANNTWFFVNLNTNFCYNGTSNLLIINKNYDGSWTSGYGATYYSSLTASPVGQQYRMAYVYQDPSYPANGTAMTRQQRVSNIRLYY